MNSEPPPQPERDERLGEILAEWIEAAERGAAPHSVQWLAHHAEFATELKEFLANRARLGEAAEPLCQAVRAAVAVAPSSGELDEAAAEFYAAIQSKKDKADAYCNFGRVLQRMGRFAEALVYLRRGHELGTKNPQWPHPSAQWVRECARFLVLDPKLPAILSGKLQPVDVEERLDLARLCQLPCKMRYSASLRFLKEAFAVEPKLIGDLPSLPRYDAARAAALTGCGHGSDAAKVNDNERARMRQQALDWLHSDLDARRKLMERSADLIGPWIVQQMKHWLQDDAFAGVRGPGAGAMLPEAEYSQWQKLWEQVESLRRSAATKAATARPVRP